MRVRRSTASLPGTQQQPAQHTRNRREDRAEQKRHVVAAIERGCGAFGSLHRVAARGRETCEHRETERAAHHERRIDDTGREARIARVDVAHGGQQHGIERDAGTEAKQDHAGQHVEHEAAVDRCPCKQREPDRCNEQSSGKGHTQTETHHHARRQTQRKERHDQIGRQKREPDLQRPQHECGEQQTQRLRRGPAGFIAVHHRVHGEHQRSRDRHRTGHVEPFAMSMTARGRQERDTERVDGDANRQVDEKDPVPAQQVGQQAAEQDADAAATRADKTIHAHRLGPFAGLGEQIHDQRQRHSGDDRTAQALHGTRAYQQDLRVRHAASERGQREQRDAAEKKLAVAVQIAEPPAQQQAAAEREHVRIDHPHQRGLAKTEVGCDRRQRNVHDRRIEHDHEHAEAQNDQCQPALVAVDGMGHAGTPLP
ncbi:hypothetical protein KCU90_g1839, partial [Aureobasidium melanogenum]